VDQISNRFIDHLIILKYGPVVPKKLINKCLKNLNKPSDKAELKNN